MDVPPDPDAHPLTLYKRWRLRASVSTDDVRQFVDQHIIPTYRRLSSEVELGFEVEIVETDEGGTHAGSILAVQRWSSRAAHTDATSGEAFHRWWADYQPTLVEWDRLVEFVDEWSTTPVTLAPGPSGQPGA